jgi:hypothetical protein
MSEELDDIYDIPGNYKTPGKWKGYSIPSAIEGVIVASIFEFMLMQAPFTFTFRVVIFIVSFVGILFLFIRGINGERISKFLLSFIFFLWRKLSNNTKYHMRKVGLKDVETLENRDSSDRANNYQKLLSTFKKRS